MHPVIIDADVLRKRGFDPDQRRGPDGRWVDEGDDLISALHGLLGRTPAAARTPPPPRPSDEEFRRREREAFDHAVEPSHPASLEFVEQVSTDSLHRFREYDRTGGPQDVDEDYFQRLKRHIRLNGVGEPVILEYDVDAGTVHVGEGNHRVRAARELGIAKLPARVLTTSRRGKRSAPVPTPLKPDQFNYVPEHVKPSQIGIR